MITVNKKKTHENSNHGKSYLAPEVVKYRQYSPVSDIYSVGRMVPVSRRLLFSKMNSRQENRSKLSLYSQLTLNILWKVFSFYLR